MILRNLQRQPVRAGLSALGVAFAVAILVVGMFSLDAIEVILDMQYNVSQRQDYTVAFVEPRSTRALHELAHLPGVLAVEPVRSVPARMRAGHGRGSERSPGSSTARACSASSSTSLEPVPLPRDGLVLSAKLAEILHVRRGDTVSRWSCSKARGPYAAVVVTELVDEYMGTSAYMEISALQRFLQEGPTNVGRRASRRQGQIRTSSTGESKRCRRSPVSARSAPPSTTSATRSPRT